MLTEKLQILTRIKKIVRSLFSTNKLIFFIFGLIQISICLSVFGFDKNEHK
jgi:hypothetical protein